jgi:dTDP-4-amino-4,6-dideoxygalactose transaminase
VLAGIGRGQLEVLNTRVAQRRANFKYYTKALAHTNLQFLQEPTGYFSNRWLSCITTPSLKVRETIRTQLLAVGIESRPLWKPMHLQPIFKQYPRYSNGISEKLFETGLCLPSGSNLTENDLESVVRVLKDF